MTEPTDSLDETEVEDSATAQDPLATLQADMEKFRDLAMRTQADFENYRKRAAREKEDALRFANASLLQSLLPVIDSFDLGLAAAREENTESAVFQGMSMVRKQLEDFLADSGVKVIEASGQVFDSNLHEAVGQEASEDVPEGHVIRQLRKGYMFRDRLLRPATVFISTGQSDS